MITQVFYLQVKESFVPNLQWTFCFLSMPPHKVHQVHLLHEFCPKGKKIHKLLQRVCLKRWIKFCLLIATETISILKEKRSRRIKGKKRRRRQKMSRKWKGKGNG